MENNRRNFVKKAFGVLAGLTLLPIENIIGKSSKKATMGETPFVGEIAIFGFDFAPVDWLRCDGQAVPSASYPALYALIGTTYGGNSTNFNLPNLNGKVPIGYSATYPIGSTGGATTVALTAANLANHTHTLLVNSGSGNATSPSGNYLAANVEGIQQYSNTNNATMNSAAVQSTGTGTAHSNMQPYVAMNYCIAFNGLWPTRP